MKKQKGITLIALVITIIVLLILAGVTIAMIAGQDSAPQKAVEARNANKIGEAKDAAALLVTDYIQQYYNGKYVENDAEAKNATDVGAYINAKLATAVTKGNHVMQVVNGELVVKDTSGNEIVSGTIQSNGTITWAGEATGSGNSIINPTGITITNNSDKTTIKEGETLSLSASIQPSGAEGTIQWQCSPSGAVTFSPATGTSTTVTAVTPGSATITAKIQGKTITSSGLNITIQELTKQNISTLTSSNYGNYIILGDAISGVGNSTNQDDWKIVYKDSSKVYAMLTDYLPNTNSVCSAALYRANNSSYAVCYQNRDKLITQLNNASLWEGLISSTIRTKYTGIKVYGGKERSFYLNLSTTYRIPTSANSYATHGCYGYWTTSKHTGNSYYAWYIKYDGTDNNNGENSASSKYGVCPVVELPNAVQVVKKANNLWEVR